MLRAKGGRSKTLARSLIVWGISALIIGLLSSLIIVSRSIRIDVDRMTKGDLAMDAALVADMLRLHGEPAPGAPPIPEQELSRWAKMLHTRITLIAPDGRVLADSEVPYAELGALDNHRDRVEVREAMETGKGTDRRYSETTRGLYLYYAVKISGEGTGGVRVVRCSMPMSHYFRQLSRMRFNVIAALLAAAAVAFATGAVGVGRVTRPIRLLTRTVRAARRGEAVRYPHGDFLEIDELSGALRENAAEQARMLEELEDERGNLLTVVRYAPCGLLLADADGIVSCVNGQFAPMLRGNPDSAVGVQAGGALRNSELVELLSRTLQCPDGDVGEEVKITLRRGKAEQFFEARAVRAGRREVLLILNDVTERRMAEDARKSFVADAGHEFQTPLASISAAAELLLGMEDSSQTEREPYLREILRQRERLTLLADDLLLLSRLESGVPTGEAERFDLAEVVSAEVGEMEKSARAEKLEWSAEISPCVPILGRRAEIRRAVSNLLDNAVKYTAKRYGDAPGGKITVTLAAEGQYCSLSVTDNGVGIPSGEVGRIFGRFERAERHRAREGKDAGGYGLGLAIAKTVIESHDGTICAETKDGLTTFCVTLPLSLREDEG